MINYKLYNQIISEQNPEEKDKLIELFSKSLQGVGRDEKEELLNRLNPKAPGNYRFYMSDSYVKSVEELNDIEKLKYSMNLQREKDKVDMIETRQTFFGKKIVKKIVNIVALTVLSASLLTTGIAVGRAINAENKMQDTQSRYEYVMKENEDLRQENEEARKALLGDKANDFVNQNKSLKELVNEFISTTNASNKEEMKEAYKMIVEIFEANGFEFKDIYNEETGEYDVEKLNDQARDLLNDVCKQANQYENLQNKISATLDLLQIPNKTEGGIKKIEDYANLNDAIDDIMAYKDTYYNDQLISIKIAVDEQYKLIGKDITVDKDFGGDIEKAVSGMSEEFASKINSECESIDDVLDFIDGLSDKYDELEQSKQELQEKYDRIVNDYQKEIDEKTEGSVQTGTERSEEETVITPVADDEKDEQNNAGKENSGTGREDDNGSVSGKDEYQR